MGKSIDNEELLRAVLQGIRGFVSYRNANNELAHAVHAIAQGHLWISREVLEKLSNSQAITLERGNSRGFRLTPREAAIMTMLQQRLSNKEMGSKLVISERTVKFHLKNLFEKLGVHDRYSAVDLAREIHLPEADYARKT